MPARIRICNESEARLMIQDGSFLDYLRHWDEQFPQTGGMEWLNRFGYSPFKPSGLKGSGLDGKDYMALYKVGHIDNTVLFEIGESIILKKEKNCWSLFHKIDNIWVQDRAFKNLHNLFYDFSAWSYLFPTISTEVLVSEQEIRRTKDLKKLAKQVLQQIMKKQGGYLNHFFKLGNLELWEVDDDPINLRINGEGFQNCIIRKDLKSIESHLRQYGKKH